jgi:hypothetical protein
MLSPRRRARPQLRRPFISLELGSFFRRGGCWYGGCSLYGWRRCRKCRCGRAGISSGLFFLLAVRMGGKVSIYTVRSGWKEKGKGLSKYCCFYLDSIYIGFSGGRTVRL